MECIWELLQKGLAMSCEINKANVGYGRCGVSTCTTLGSSIHEKRIGFISGDSNEKYDQLLGSSLKGGFKRGNLCFDHMQQRPRIAKAENC
jgi:hypothetical protein